MSWLVANTIAAGLLAVATLVVARWRPAPAVLHVLWLFVLLKLVTPPLFVLPVDLSWFGGAPEAPRTVVVPLRLEVGELAAAPLPASVPPEAAGTVAAWNWPGAALGAWAAGSGLMLAWLLVGLWRGGRRLRSLPAAPLRLQREIARLAADLGVRAPALRDDATASSPYVWSFGRTCLVVPARALAAVTDKGRAAVLAHELAHLRRGDHWLAHAELLLAVALWWHPLFWFARSRMRHQAELACDAWALRSVPDATLDYATVLVQAVAAPDSAVSAPAVLAVRPAARAAFEQRLKMILNETVPCRASRAWLLPFASLAIGLFTVPVVAQHKAQQPAKVELRVNGKQIDELSAAERKALLQKLHAAEAAAAAEAAEPQEPAVVVAPAKAKHKLEAKVRLDAARGAEMPSAAEIGDMVRAGLAEAKVDIANEADLRELGIADDVVRLVDDLGAGKGLGDNLDAVIKGAMKGAGKLVQKEIAADKDLQELGLTDGIAKLVRGFLENERTQEMIFDFARSAADKAMKQARKEVQADPDLQQLGLTVEVEGLLDSLFSGHGDFDAKLQGLIETSLQAAKAQAGAAAGGETEPAEVAPAPKKKAKTAKLESR
ncbi:MAG: M56 family metallopeptidase [Phycisphaerales bacterium]|nr:M56 family metallopeptidase [Phycisphaerales bacterium]